MPSFFPLHPPQVNDSPVFQELVEGTVNNGFRIGTVLADAGYSSKNNYALCKRLGIFEVYIDFKSNARLKLAPDGIWKEKLRLFQENKKQWDEVYRYRQCVEGVMSVIKKKTTNYLRSRKPTSQDVELLLKALVYNLTIIGRYF